jgi:hypothetical protein
MDREPSEIGPLLDTGTLTELRPLGEGGDQIVRSAPQLRHTIRQLLGADVAASLAIPVPDDSGSRFDWYAQDPGSVRRWADLAEDERAAVQAQLGEVNRRIAALADEMSRDDGSSADTRRQRQTLGRLLRQVTTYPDESHLFLVDQRPVIAFWGFSRREEGDPSTPIADGITIHRAPHPNTKRRRPRQSLSERLRRLFEDRRTHLPIALVAAMLLLSAIVLILWLSNGEPTAPEPEPEPEPGSEPAPTPTPPVPPEVDEGEPIVIPIEAIETGSIDFLSGQWRAVGDRLVETETGLPIQLTYRMDAGRGEVLVTELDGTLCRADVTATFDGRTLVLTPLTPVRCPVESGRPSYYGVTVSCQPTTDQRSSCTGQYPDGEAFRVELLRHDQ